MGWILKSLNCGDGSLYALTETSQINLSAWNFICRLLHIPTTYAQFFYSITLMHKNSVGLLKKSTVSFGQGCTWYKYVDQRNLLIALLSHSISLDYTFLSIFSAINHVLYPYINGINISTNGRDCVFILNVSNIFVALAYSRRLRSQTLTGASYYMTLGLLT